MADTLDAGVLSELLESVGDDPDFIGELVDTYLADAPPLLGQMRDAITAGSSADLVRPVHTLKGASWSIGASRLGELCAALEQQARSGDLTGAGEAAASIEAEYAAVVAALEHARRAGWVA